MPNVAVLITDAGTNIDMERTVSDAVAAKVKGTRILGIGLGGDVNMWELNAIVSQPSTILLADSWKDLPNRTMALLDALCDGMCLFWHQLKWRYIRTSLLLLLLLLISLLLLILLLLILLYYHDYY